MSISYSDIQSFLHTFQLLSCYSNDALSFVECRAGFLAEREQPCKPCSSNRYGSKCSNTCNCKLYERFVIIIISKNLGRDYYF